jgi:hypothetical protein
MKARLSRAAMTFVVPAALTVISVAALAAALGAGDRRHQPATRAPRKVGHAHADPGSRAPP